MGLLEKEIQELREMNELVAKGDISIQEVNARIAIYSQVEKRARLMLKACALNKKLGHKTGLNGVSVQLIGD